MRWARLRMAVTLIGMVAVVGPSIGSCVAVVWTPSQRLFRSKCGACHRRPARTRFDRAGWERVLNKHSRRFTLTPQDKKQLLDWLSSRDAPVGVVKRNQ